MENTNLQMDLCSVLQSMAKLPYVISYYITAQESQSQPN